MSALFDTSSSPLTIPTVNETSTAAFPAYASSIGVGSATTSPFLLSDPAPVVAATGKVFAASGETLCEGGVVDVNDQAQSVQSNQLPFKFDATLDARLEDSPTYQRRDVYVVGAAVERQLRMPRGACGFSSVSRVAILGSSLLTSIFCAKLNCHYLVSLDYCEMEAKPGAYTTTAMKVNTGVVRDVHWLTSNSCIAAVDGELEIFSAMQSGLQLTVRAPVHSEAIREIAVRNNVVASGGLDKILVISDLEAGKAVLRMNHEDVVGSVKWKQDNWVSATLDCGRFMLYDIRQRPLHPAVDANTQKQWLFTHELFSDSDILLGYSNGELSHMDLRMQKITSSVADPDVDCVGNLDFNDEGAVFTVGGCGNFTVWKLVGGALKFWSHDIPGPEPYSTQTAFLNKDVVIAATSTGEVVVHALRK